MSAAPAIQSAAPALPSTREELVVAYSSLVRRVASNLMHRLPKGQTSVELDDLFNIGMLGLFDAAERYSAENGQRFESFAEIRVRGAMLDELRKRDFFPRRLRAKANKLRRAERRLRSELDREPTPEELAADLALTLDQLHDLRRDVAPYSFVDKDDPTVHLPSMAPSPFEAVFASERRELLVAALGQLSEREQIILELHFVKGHNQRSIAESFGLTEGRISQLKSGALKKLRTILSSSLVG